MREHALTIRQPGAVSTIVETAALTDAFLSGKSPRTIAAYRQDLEDFRQFVSAATIDDAARILLGSGPGNANMTALNYRAWMMERGLSAATVNRRLAALRSLVALAQTVGMVPFELKVPGMRSQAYRDTRGPGD